MGESPKFDPVGRRIPWLSTPHVFAVIVLALLSRFDWPWRWLWSGAPALTYSILLGAAKGTRFLPVVPLWPLFTTLHLIYCVAATSWLLYWVFAAACYPLVFLSCLFQFEVVGKIVRRRLRALLKGSQFVSDKIALFDLPALEIDTEVDGLFVVRGITLSLSSLEIIAYGVEVGIKLNHDMELAITTDKVKVSLFRKIEIGDVFANLKGGAYEMTFGDATVDDAEERDPGQSPLLRSATLSAQSMSSPSEEKSVENEKVKLPDQTIPRKPVPATSPPDALESIRTVSDDNAKEQYEAALNRIHNSSLITRSRKAILDEEDDESTFDRNNEKHVRATICARLHDKPSIPHPPQKSIAVSTLRNQSSPATRRFLHRLPMLLRLLLNPLSYFHPITITSVTAGGSGRWTKDMLSTYLFQYYSDTNADIRRLETRINAWLTSANFVLQLNDMAVFAHVPFLTAYDIEARLAIADVIVYRVVQAGESLAQIIRLRGADANVTIPSFLLPHHEHLFPPEPSEDDVEERKKKVDEADGLPKTVEAATELEKTIRDEANINLSARARLPAVFDQQLLEFVAALVKATKFIEIEKSIQDRYSSSDNPATPADLEILSDNSDTESIKSTASNPSPRWSDFKVSVKTLNRKAATGLEKTWKRGVVGGMANDRWIAKLVGKVTRLLETVQGDVGYSGDIPVPMKPYRAAAESDAKILA